ncbi:MAG: ferrous iron transport protein A [Oscillospiraceae bacterium]
MAVRSLGDIKIGSFGIVTSINVAGALKRRLIDMGITPGVKIKIIRVAPLGDPIQIGLRGYELSIRRSDAVNIFVRKDEVDG